MELINRNTELVMELHVICKENQEFQEEATETAKKVHAECKIELVKDSSKFYREQ